MALSAASPIFRGILVDTDCRWSVIEASVDDRTRQERGLEPLISAPFRIPKSRYASVSRFISERPEMRPEYNDIDAPHSPKALERLLEAGVDEQLAMHIAHLFIRDPLVIFSELLQQDNSESSDHFENIQSTNWQTCRFKPPSLTSELGWRVEFRPMEVQLTDTENAAFAIYPILLIRSLLHFNQSLYIPISLVDANMARAQKRDAINNELFYSRTNTSSPIEMSNIALKSLKQIIDEFNVLINRYLLEMEVDSSIISALSNYTSLIANRAAGILPTPAAIIRNFVLNHPEYASDSVVPDQIIYDLMQNLSSYN